MQTYEIEEADGMTLFIAVNEIREKQDPSLQRCRRDRQVEMAIEVKAIVRGHRYAVTLN